MTHGSGSVSSRSPRAAARESSASAVAWAISPAPSGVLAAHDRGVSGLASSPSRWCSTAATDRAPSIGERRKDVIEALIALLRDPQLRVRLAAVDALGRMNAVDALTELDRLAGSDVEGRLRSMAMEAAQKIRAGTQQSDELKRLREDVDQLRASNARLQSRLAELEPAIASNGKRPKR